MKSAGRIPCARTRSIHPSPAAARSRSARAALGLNRADVMFRTGNHLFIPDFPQAQGLQASGTIESVGLGVTAVENPGEATRDGLTTGGGRL
jgi:NADPH:quinone reductase-like Zn-dependent oxidoreductase